MSENLIFPIVILHVFKGLVITTDIIIIIIIIIMYLHYFLAC
jgi:hypothetical protein